MQLTREEQIEVKNTVMPFGKYKGKTIDEIYQRDDGEYLQWCIDNFDKCDIKNSILQYMRCTNG